MMDDEDCQVVGHDDCPEVIGDSVTVTREWRRYVIPFGHRAVPLRRR